MSATTTVRRVVTTGVATAAMVAATTTGTPAASASVDSACAIGMVPLTNQNTWVRSEPGFTHVLHTLPAWSGFRIGAGPVAADGLVWWFGHGNHTSNGWVPEQNLTCA
jgi:hypothetical protein